MSSTWEFIIVRWLLILTFVQRALPTFADILETEFLETTNQHYTSNTPGLTAFTNSWNCTTNSSLCYFISTKPQSWADANKKCVELGGALPSGTSFTKAITGIIRSGPVWSSLRWYNGRLHKFGTWNTPGVMKLADLQGPVLHYVAKQQHCFTISVNLTQMNGPNPPLDLGGSQLIVDGYKCDEHLPYFCVIERGELSSIMAKLALPLETASDVELEKCLTSEGKEELRCTAKFRSPTVQRPYHIVWIMDHMYYSSAGNKNSDGAPNGGEDASGDGEPSGDGESSNSGDVGGSGSLTYDNDLLFGGDGIVNEANAVDKGAKKIAVLPLTYDNFTSYVCEVRYLGIAYGNRSNEIQVSTPSVVKLAVVTRIDIKHSISFNVSCELAGFLKQMLKYGNHTYDFELQHFGKDVYDMMNSEFVRISYYSLQFQKNYPPSFRFLRWEKGPVTKLLLVDRCRVESFTEDLASDALAGQEVTPPASKTSPTCLDKYGNLVTRTCYASLVSDAVWVEPFSVGQNCSQWGKLELPGYCPLGYERKVSDHQEYCVKKVSATTWGDAMAVCFGGYKRHPEWYSNGYEARHWITNALDFIKRYDRIPTLVEDLVWLPSRRRVPGSPLYPYFVDPKSLEELPTLNYWEMQFSARNLTSADEEVIQLDYSYLDSKELCLAWSTKEQKLFTRLCSEHYQTVCVKKVAYPNATLNLKPLSPNIFGVQKCEGFDTLLPSELGRHACYQLITPTSANSTLGFTWEEAVLECQRKHPNATLPVTPEYLLSYIMRDFAKEKLNDGLWLGFRKRARSSLGANNECRFVNTKNECFRPPSSVDRDTDFRYGVYASTTQIESELNGSFWTLEPTGKLLKGAICELEYNPVEKPALAYSLRLEWGNATDDVRIFLKYNGQPQTDFKRENWRFVLSNLVCFLDGNLLNMVGESLKSPKKESDSDNVMEMRFDLTNHTSVHCESMSLHSVFLSSNTLTTRRSDLRFIVVLRDRKVKISKEPNPKHPPNHERLLNQSLDVSPSLLNRSSYAKYFEPRVTERSHFNASVKHYTGIFKEMINKTDTDLHYVITHVHFDRVSTNDSNQENLLVVYHINVLNTTNDPILSQQSVYKELSKMLNSTLFTMDNAISVAKIRGTVVCLPEAVAEKNVGSLTWPETRLQKTTFSREGCVLEGGSLVQRTCNGDAYYGAEWGPMQAWSRRGALEVLPDGFVCSVPSHTTSQLITLTQTSEKATSILADLQHVTKDWEPSLADVQLTTNILLNAARQDSNFSDVDVNRTASVIEQLLTVDTETLAAAQKIPSVSTSLLAGLEQILTRTESENVTLTTPKLAARVATIGETSSLFFGGSTNQLGEKDDTVNQTVIKPDPSVNDTFQYDFAVTLHANSLPGGHSKVAFVFHPNIRLVDAATVESKHFVHVFSSNSSDGNTETQNQLNNIPNSVLVQIGLTGGPVELVQNVSLYFRPFYPSNVTDPEVSILCAFWNPKSNAGSGGWSTDGCWYLGNENGLDHCQCNHFSAFITLYAYNGADLGVHKDILNFITTLGCSLSLLGLVGIIGTYLIFPQWRKASSTVWGNHVTFNLSLALAFLLAVFLGGLERTEDPLVCLSVAASLHYSMLAIFCWMLVEAYCHHLLFVRVFNTYINRFMWKACLFAWLTPAIPVLLTLSLNRDLYDYKESSRYCCLTPEGFYYTLLPFVGLISVINLATYVRILVSVMCMRSVAQTSKNQGTLRLHQLNMAIATFLLMGLTWVFGLLAVGQARTFFGYLFCVFASSQGAAMFFFFVVKEKRTQELWTNFVRNISSREQDRERRRQMVKTNSKEQTIIPKPKHSTGSARISSSLDAPRSQICRNEYELYNM